MDVPVPDLSRFLGPSSDEAIKLGFSAVKAHVVGTAAAVLAIGALTETGTAGLREAMWSKINVDYRTGTFKDTSAYTDAYDAIELYGEALTNAVLDAPVTPAGGGAAAGAAGVDLEVALADAAAQARGPRLRATLEGALKDLRSRHASAKISEDR